jgi:acyl-CoA thioesterase FadM
MNALTVEANFASHDCAYVEDPLVVHMSMRKRGRLRFSFVYELRRDTDNALIASGQTVHVLVDSAGGQPCRVPEWFYAALQPLLQNGEAA